MLRNYMYIFCLRAAYTPLVIVIMRTSFAFVSVAKYTKQTPIVKLEYEEHPMDETMKSYSYNSQR